MQSSLHSGSRRMVVVQMMLGPQPHDDLFEQMARLCEDPEIDLLQHRDFHLPIAEYSICKWQLRVALQ